MNESTEKNIEKSDGLKKVVVNLPEKSKLLFSQIVFDTAHLWVLFDPHAAEEKVEKRTFCWHFKATSLKSNVEMTFLNTVPLEKGGCIQHLLVKVTSN